MGSPQRTWGHPEAPPLRVDVIPAGGLPSRDPCPERGRGTWEGHRQWVTHLPGRGHVHRAGMGRGREGRGGGVPIKGRLF